MLWITAALGACFLGIQWGLRDSPPLWFAALRALLGGAALGVVAVVRHRPVPRGHRTWGMIALLGLVNVTLVFGAMFAGVGGVATGTAAVLANAQPLLILLPAWWLYGERLNVRTGLAMTAGFAGLLVGAVPGGGGSGALVSLLAAAAVTAGTLMVRHLEGVDVVVVSAAHFVIGGAALAVIAAFSEGTPHIVWTPRFVIVLAFLGLVATAATTLAWFIEIQRSPMAAVTVWMFLVPVFGLVLGTVVLGERPSRWTLLGVGMVLLSMRFALGQAARAPMGQRQTGGAHRAPGTG